MSDLIKLWATEVIIYVWLFVFPVVDALIYLKFPWLLSGSRSQRHSYWVTWLNPAASASGKKAEPAGFADKEVAKQHKEVPNQHITSCYASSLPKNICLFIETNRRLLSLVTFYFEKHASLHQTWRHLFGYPNDSKHPSALNLCPVSPKFPERSAHCSHTSLVKTKIEGKL